MNTYELSDVWNMILLLFVPIIFWYDTGKAHIVYTLKSLFIYFRVN